MDNKRARTTASALIFTMLVFAAPGGHSLVDADTETDLASGLRENLAGQPGFIALAPATDGSGVFYAFFAGQAPDVVVPQGMDVRFLENVEPQRMMYRLNETVEGLQQPATGPTNPIDFNFARPGSPILTSFSGMSGLFICTLSFFFEDQETGAYYASTAGHCLLPAGKSATHGPGADWDPADTTVRVCVNACFFGGQLTGLNGMIVLGEVAYARQVSNSPFTPGDVGNDFGLIEINPALYTPPTDWVTPTMAVWQGPNGRDDIEGFDQLVHYGNGIDAGTIVPTKARAGNGLNDGVVWKWQAALEINGGDSGSPISHLDPLGANGGNALGVITHGIGVAGVGIPGLGFGTPLGRGMGLASSDAGLDIELVFDGTDLNIPPQASFASNCSGLSCTFDASASNDADGAVVAYEWDFGDAGAASVPSASTSHTYSDSGSYTVTLQVRDDDGAVSDPEDAVAKVANLDPTASFAFTCEVHTCSFDASASSDADGTVSSYAWDLGDGNTTTGATPSHTYGGAGTYPVRLTVADNAGGTDSSSRDATTPAPPGKGD